MNQIKYLNFDLLFERNGDGYQARVLESPGGEETESFVMPFSEEELETYLNCLGESAQSEESFEDAAMDFGSRLFDTVFKGEIYACLRVSLEEARDEEKGLRIILRLKDVPDLGALPWEYLYNENLGFLSRSSDTPVVRYIELPRRIRPLTIKPPLRVLVMISNPSDYPSLAGDEELAKLRESFDDLRRQDLVEIELLKEATESSLRQHLRRKRNWYHVFHFIGHGGYDKDNDDGFLIMEDEENYGRRINGKGLANLLHAPGSLRLALLNACDGARASLTNPFGGTAQSLVQAGIPAVIAMQFPITDHTAIAFAHEFYKTMAEYWPVDAAMAEARLAINESGWGTPALYMRSYDGHIFEPEHSSPDPPTASSPVEFASSYNLGEMYYRGMVDAIEEGNLIPFIGAGANLCGRISGDWQGGPFAPSDIELAAHLSTLRPLPDNLRDLAGVSQYVALEDMKILNSELRSVLTRAFLPTPLHEFLARLPRILKEKSSTRSHQLIVTMNYDNVLERAFEAEKVPYDVVSYIASGDHSGKFCHKPYGEDPVIVTEANQYDAVSLDRRTVILKIHGAVGTDPSQDSYVITEDNYIDHLSRTDFINLLPVNILAKLIDNNSKFLFLGYRLRDWNLRIIFRRIWGEEGPKSKSWALGLDSDPFDIEYWKKRNVRILENMNLKQFVEELERRLK